MNYKEFMELVTEQTDLGSEDEVLSITRATLETLGERIYRSARDDLASQLPNQLKQLLVARALPENTPHDVDRFSLEEFYNRVSARAEMGHPRAVKSAQAVMSVLKDAVSAGEWQDLGAELPAEYNEIL